MRVTQHHWRDDSGWSDMLPRQAAAGLVLVFGGTDVLNAARIAELQVAYPAAALAGCSTSGEILGGQIHDDTITATALCFAGTRVRMEQLAVPDTAASLEVGRELGQRLLADDLVHVLVFAPGLAINGSQLAAGLRAALPVSVAVTGGLAGDGTRFAQTRVVANGLPDFPCIAAVGFYGSRLRVSHGSLGGWDDFGPDRRITRAAGNVLYELDGEPALALYKRYLGEHAAGLPATGLLFPLALRDQQHGDLGLVRTILAVNEADQSMTFAGDMPEGMFARMMRANFERLIGGAANAAGNAAAGLAGDAGLALLISCVGRRLVLKQRCEDELDSVRQVLGFPPAFTGFYSYGELSPYTPTARCELHNQTMTITLFAED